jgi:hypothetical protein
MRYTPYAFTRTNVKQIPKMNSPKILIYESIRLTVRYFDTLKPKSAVRANDRVVRREAVSWSALAVMT